MIRRLLLGLTLVVVLPAPAGAVPITGIYGAIDCGEYTAPAHPARVFMVGDSLTASGRAELRRLKPRWEIDGLRGRSVDCLTPIVEERLTAGPIGKLVIALGTNAREAWTRADYQTVVDLVPAATPVVFVTTVRDRRIFNVENGWQYRALASTQYRYTMWMTAIATARPHTCLAPWRQYVLRHPSVLYDGVHAEPGWGRQVWARIVANTVGRCWGAS